jgi:hypothetical protein
MTFHGLKALSAAAFYAVMEVRTEMSACTGPNFTLLHPRERLSF